MLREISTEQSVSYVCNILHSLQLLAVFDEDAYQILSQYNNQLWIKVSEEVPKVLSIFVSSIEFNGRIPGYPY